MAWFAAAAAAAFLLYKAYKRWHADQDDCGTPPADWEAVHHTARNHPNFDPTTVEPFDLDEPVYACCVCRERLRDCVVLPCGDQVMCEACAPGQVACPACRTRIDERVRVFDA